MIYSWFFNQLTEAEFVIFCKLVKRIDPFEHNFHTLKCLRPKVIIPMFKKLEQKILQDHKLIYNNLIQKLETYAREN